VLAGENANEEGSPACGASISISCLNRRFRNRPIDEKAGRSYARYHLKLSQLYFKQGRDNNPLRLLRRSAPCIAPSHQLTV
jgi:hypothetical protein